MKFNLRNPGFVGSLSRPAVGGGGGDLATATLTIPAQTETLTDFPVYVRMSDLSAGWWNSVTDQNQVRVRDNGDSYVPYHVAGVSIPGKTGGLWFKGTLSNSQPTVFKLVVTADATANPAAGPVGSNAVWSDYARVYICDPSRRDWTDVENASRGLIDGGTTSDVTTSDGGFGIRETPVLPYILKATNLPDNGTVFTMAVTGAVNVSTGANQSVMSWTNGAYRVTFLFPDGIGGRPIGVWDAYTSWLFQE